MKAYGAELVLSDGSKGMLVRSKKLMNLQSSIQTASLQASLLIQQTQSSFETTGPEIYEDTEGNVDVFVAGVGTGGTITGVGKYLKSKKPSVKIVAVEPASSAVLSTGNAGPHKIQGIGAGFVPEVLNTEIYDEIITVENDDAFSAARLASQTEGLLVGISSGRSAACRRSARQTTGECRQDNRCVVARYGGALPLHRAV